MDQLNKDLDDLAYLAHVGESPGEIRVRRVQDAVQELRAEIVRLRGVANILADRLGRHTGHPMPVELAKAEAAEAAGDNEL